MKSKIAVILLAVFLCLTTGCNNASHIAKTPDPISSSDSNIVPSESETAQAEKKTEVDRPQSTESQTDSRAAEFPASVSESDTQTTEVPDQADHSTAVLPQAKASISLLGEKLKELRKEVKLCQDIAVRSKVIEEKVDAVRAEEEKSKRKENRNYEQRR